jgi:hypothetical protein
MTKPLSYAAYDMRIHDASGRRCSWSGYHSALRPHLLASHQCILAKCLIGVEGGGWIAGADQPSQGRIASTALSGRDPFIFRRNPQGQARTPHPPVLTPLFPAFQEEPQHPYRPPQALPAPPAPFPAPFQAPFPAPAAPQVRIKPYY